MIFAILALITVATIGGYVLFTRLVNALMSRLST